MIAIETARYHILCGDIVLITETPISVFLNELKYCD